MNLFRKIFGDKNSNVKENEILSQEHFFELKYIKELVDKYKKPTILLRPHKANQQISNSESKFGGIPNLENFNSYPCCSECETPLNFVFQLYKKDFPTFYFPEETNLFQLFRCPNNDCPDAYSEKYDHKMFTFYSNSSPMTQKELLKPSCNLKELEIEVPDCFLKPLQMDDFPNYDDFNGNDFTIIEEKFGEDVSEKFMEEYCAIQRTKIGGYPSYTQSPEYPVCSCGKTKEFIFQLSSEDMEDGVENPPPADMWSPHGIMIGDVGNIYFYVCKSCGKETIESNWDCY